MTAAASDVGRRRSGNEDSYAVWSADDDGGAHPADRLLVVCDGMGGTVAGEVASRMAVDAVVKAFEESAANDAAGALSDAVHAANDAVWEHSKARPDLAGMGTTCTAIAIKGDEVTIAHVGDSRAYLVRGHEITQLTQDHSLVAQLVARHELTAEQARLDSRRNVVTRSVGVGPEVDVDVITLREPLRPGDTLLVCSDGLHGPVDDDQLARAAANGPLEQAARALIQLANDRGGPDNITAVLARLESPHADAWAPAEAPSRHRAARRASLTEGGGRRNALRMLIVALLALVVAIGGLTWIVFGMMRDAPDPAPPDDNAGVATWR
jgi:serine/threonine protein phosphatase PrpC